MKNHIFLILIVATVALSACNNAAVVPESERPTPLPTAVPPPANGGTGFWAISFNYEFPEEFWPEGIHRYAFNLECPDDLTQMQFGGNWNIFEVAETGGYSPEPVYLRLNGLSVEPFAPAYQQNASINPLQKTVAIIHFLGLPETVAQRAGDECEAFIAWDNLPPQPLTPLEPFQP